MTNSILELPEVEKTGLVTQALAIKIIDTQSRENAANILKDLVIERKSIIEQTEGVIKQAYELHKSLKSDQNVLVKPIEAAESYLRSELGRYEAEQLKIRYEAERKAEAERRKAEDEARLKAAEEAEKVGNSQMAEAVLEGIYTPDEVFFAGAAHVNTPTEAPKLSGVSFVTVYDLELQDKVSFIRWVASKPEFMHFLDINESAVKQFAKSTQGSIAPAGIKIIKKQVARTTGR